MNYFFLYSDFLVISDNMVSEQDPGFPLLSKKKKKKSRTQGHGNHKNKQNSKGQDKTKIVVQYLI